MEFLIAAVVIAVGVYLGYQYYKVKTSLGHEPTILELTEEVKVDVAAVEAKAEVAVEAVKTEIKKEPVKKAPKSPAKAAVAEKRTRKGGKFVGDDKSTPDVNEAFKEGKAPAKKKPNIKIAK